MIIYRIGDCKYVNDLSGKGAAMYGGRWNSKDIYMVYTAESRALALLESVVHMGRIPPAGYCMIAIKIPDNSIEEIVSEKLPAGWQTNPPPDQLKEIGDNFIKSNKHLALRIPSAVMMEEHNYLINPAHPDFNKVHITAQRPLKIDERLFPVSRIKQ